jgi:hypothetical protein
VQHAVAAAVAEAYVRSLWRSINAGHVPPVRAGSRTSQSRSHSGTTLFDGGLIQRALSSIVAFHSANLPEKVCREVERKTEVSRFVVSDSPVLLICAIEDFTHVAE